MRLILLNSIVLHCLDEQKWQLFLFPLDLRWIGFHTMSTRMVNAPFFSHTGNVQQRLLMTTHLELLISLYKGAFHDCCSQLSGQFQIEQN